MLGLVVAMTAVVLAQAVLSGAHVASQEAQMKPSPMKLEILAETHLAGRKAHL